MESMDEGSEDVSELDDELGSVYTTCERGVQLSCVTSSTAMVSRKAGDMGS
jgi:hypothetical protein